MYPEYINLVLTVSSREFRLILGTNATRGFGCSKQQCGGMEKITLFTRVILLVELFDSMIAMNIVCIFAECGED